jgi:hypothetical protein
MTHPMQPEKRNPAPTPQPADQRSDEFIEPKLSFIEPKLTPRGDLREVTGFLGTFSP